MSQLRVSTAAPTPVNPETAINTILNALDGVVLGKKYQLRLALSCLLANGHLLIEDVPGVGKTTLAHALAAVLGLNFTRIQFTSDMLPSDVIGVSLLNQETGSFSLHKGPLFSQLVLGDEVNRATPKTQSALLEAMEERQISIDGTTHPLPSPFFVIATQNPTEQIGTYPLPESQLDRFLMRLSLGYPDREHERQLLTGGDRRSMLTTIQAVLDASQLNDLQTQVHKVHVAEPLLDYIQNLVEFSRNESKLVNGISPRAALMLVHAARAWALVNHQDSVTPQHVQDVLGAVVDHRLVFRHSAADPALRVSEHLMSAVPIP
ncbi:MAG: AAA family ATPase [Gammaproteobacteria bacterium]